MANANSAIITEIKAALCNK